MFHFKGDMIVSWRMLVQMKRKGIRGRARTGENLSILTPCNQRTLLAIVRFCVNILAIFLLNSVSPSISKMIVHKVVDIFFPIITQFQFSRQNFNKFITIKYHKIVLLGNEFFHADRQTDGQTWRIILIHIPVGVSNHKCNLCFIQL